MSQKTFLTTLIRFNLSVWSLQSRVKLLHADTDFQHALLAHYGANEQSRLHTLKICVLFNNYLQSDLVKHTIWIL